MEGQRDRQEMAANAIHQELDAVDGLGARGNEISVQELRGPELGHEMDAQARQHE